VKDKLGDLLPWVDKLLVTLGKVNPDDDRDEVERRSQLAKFVSCLEFLVHSKLILYDRSLEEIGARSLALSEKGKVARVLDKTQDSGEVIKLIEKLRQAILIYQVGVRYYQRWKLFTRGQMSQQQSIYNQVVHLTVSFYPPPPTPRLSRRLVDFSHPSMRF